MRIPNEEQQQSDNEIHPSVPAKKPFKGKLVPGPEVLGPLLIRFTLRQSADPELDTFDPDDPDLPDAVYRHFRKVTKALQPLGFDVVQGLGLPNQTPRVKAVILMFANRDAKDAAIATVMYANAADGTRLQTAYVEIISRYRRNFSIDAGA